MPQEPPLREGQIVDGALFNEPMRVETLRLEGVDAWVAGLVGLRSEKFRSVRLTSHDLAGLDVLDTAATFEGSGLLFRLGLQAYALGIAYEFDPYFGLSVSRVDPLPHQLEAVYDHLLQAARIRFLLADDAGAGKTIMAGLLVRELKLRGLAERILIVGPANLAFQWQREMWEKFGEKFVRVQGGDVRDQFGVNQWLEHDQVITRRLASSTRALRQSLENRAHRLGTSLKKAQELARKAPVDVPTAQELEEMEDAERERLEEVLAAVSLANDADEVRKEIAELEELVERAKGVEAAGEEAKLARLDRLLREQGFFDDPQKRLLVFTEFRDTLDYLVERLQLWGFSVGFIHGNMRPGERDQRGTRLFVEQQFREGEIQVLVATEAAGEGINLQVCHILFNYDIPWNPNRLEQRMGRIHRYGQRKDCLIFNFVAVNTIEGRVLNRLLAKLQEIRDALDDDAVFNVVGEVLPAAQIERVLRDYYAGRLPARLDVYRARVVDGLGHVIHERLFVVELRDGEEPRPCELSTLGNFSFDASMNGNAAPRVATAPEATAWLHEHELEPLLEKTRADRLASVERIARHVELSLTELLQKADDEIGRACDEVKEGVPGAEGRLKQAEDRHAELLERRDRRRRELAQQRSLTLQGVERILAPNERRVAEDRADCYWLYVVTSCKSNPRLEEPLRDPGQLPWTEVIKVAHYYLSVDALKKLMEVREEPATYDVPEPTKTARIWSPRVVDRARIKDFELEVEDIKEEPDEEL
jgi:superfamily II DNA/RNA helicase